MIRQKITTGAILEIKIENQYYVYAQILNKGHGVAFFDFKINEKLTDLSVLETAKTLFILTVYDNVITNGHWLIVGKLGIRNEFKKLPMKFIQDKLNPKHFELYNPDSGKITKATKEQCIGLERASVWAANHVEDRIRDHYLGVTNVWLQHQKIKE